MPQMNNLTHEETAEASQQYVSAEELVRALASIETRQMGEAHDRVKIGEAIQQLGLDMSAEQILAEVNAERIRRISESQHAARRRKNLATVSAIVVLFVALIFFARLLHHLRDGPSAPASIAKASIGTASRTSYATQFDSLMQTFQSNSFDEGKVTFVRVMANTMPAFTVDQVHEIMTEMSFDPGRVAAAAILYPRITDRENVYKLLDTMSFDQGRKDLIERLGLDKPAGGETK
jgi:hypothetical protein